MRALGRLGDDRAGPIIVERLTDRDCGVRAAAAEAAGRVGPDRPEISAGRPNYRQEAQ